jgi:uncharacterized protein (DUF433 family)
MGVTAEHTSGFGVGVYSLSEAARIVRMRPEKVKRLLKGYAWPERPGRRAGASPALFRGQYVDSGGILNLSFLDLIELAFVRDFSRQGLSPRVIRRAAQVAADIFKDVDHPFCTYRFVTDGETLFLDAAGEEGDSTMLDLVKKQHVFDLVMKPFVKQLQYSETGKLLRWFPMGTGTSVVLDPRFSFGAPVVLEHSVPTSALYGAYKAGETDKEIAQWYGVSVRAVRAAIQYESELALPLAA